MGVIVNYNGTSPYRSSGTGATLLPTSDKHIYYDKYSKVYEYIRDDGKQIPLKSPTSGMELELTSQPNILVDHKGTKFILEERGIIPTFVPDDTLEPAHIDGDYLVGNTTGRRFPIKSDGRVVVPVDFIDVDPNLPPDELNAYFEARKQRQLAETQEYIDNKIAQDEIESQAAIEAALARMYGSKRARDNTDRFLKIINEEIANGHVLTQTETDMLNMISQNGHLPEDMPDSAIDYDHEYAYFQSMIAKAGNEGLTQEDIAKMSKLLNEPSSGRAR